MGGARVFRAEIRRKTRRFGDAREPGGWLVYLGFPNCAMFVIGWHRERIAGMQQCWFELTAYPSSKIGPRRYRRLELPRVARYAVRRGPFLGIVAGPGHFTFDIGWRWWRSGE